MRVGDAAQLHTGYAAAREVEYEVKYIDSQRDQRLSGGGKHVLDVGAFNSWCLAGSDSAIGAFVCAEAEVEPGAGSGSGVAGANCDREQRRSETV